MSATCTKCRNPLTSEAMMVNGKLWHPQCVQCFNCQKRIDDRKFHVRKQGIFCIKCYLSMFRQRCAKCCKPIKLQGVRAMDVFWHSKCFCCSMCRVQMPNKVIYHSAEMCSYIVIQYEFFCSIIYQLNDFLYASFAIRKNRKIFYHFLNQLPESSSYELVITRFPMNYINIVISYAFQLSKILKHYFDGCTCNDSRCSSPEMCSNLQSLVDGCTKTKS